MNVTLRGWPHGPRPLNDLMEFDHVIRVHPDGTVSDTGVNTWAPELHEGELNVHPDHSKWSLMTGYTGQYGYSGPVMHNSEFIGGGMARDIMERPGLYVAIVCHWEPDDEDDEDDESLIEGWGVAYILEEPEHVAYPHNPGALYDCPACESECHCGGKGECVGCQRCGVCRKDLSGLDTPHTGVCPDGC